MRYRAFGLFNQNVSAIGVSLANADRKLRHKRDLLIAGLEAGINLYEVDSSDFEAAKPLGQAVDSLERGQFLFGLRMRAYSRLASTTTVLDLVQEVTDQANLEYIDYLMLELPARGAISADLLKGAAAAKSRGMVRFIGMAGHGPEAERLLKSNSIQVASESFNLASPWSQRNYIRELSAKGLALIGEDYFPALARDAPAGRSEGETGQRGNWLARLAEKVVPGPATLHPAYRFLYEAPDWTAEELCLASALNEPAVSCFLTSPEDAAAVNRLAAVVDREIPAYIPAQIEMARIEYLKSAGL